MKNSIEIIKDNGIFLVSMRLLVENELNRVKTEKNAILEVQQLTNEIVKLGGAVGIGKIQQHYEAFFECQQQILFLVGQLSEITRMEQEQKRSLAKREREASHEQA